MKKFCHCACSWVLMAGSLVFGLRETASQAQEQNSAAQAAADNSASADSAPQQSTEKQEADTNKQADTDKPAEPAAVVDRFTVPEGDAETLVKHIGELAVYRPEGKTLAARQQDNQRRLLAVVAACDRLLESRPEEKFEVFALQNLYGALGAMGPGISEDLQKRLSELEQQLEQDPRPAVAKLPVLSRLRRQAVAVSRLPASEQTAMADQIVAYVERFGVDREILSVASGTGRALGYVGETEVAAKLYQYLGNTLAASDNAELAARADRMFGAARMLKLPGNFMEVQGITADGSEFDWASYRGKVVLVDFWASWCGPCIRELPNMKANLAAYGEKGFAIVGVNLDSQKSSFEKCVAEKEITWENIVGGELTGWDNPLATYYGISAIPTAILVDAEGKVLSLRARGAELDRLLQEQLGPPPAAEPTDSNPAESPESGTEPPSGTGTGTTSSKSDPSDNR